MGSRIGRARIHRAVLVGLAAASVAACGGGAENTATEPPSTSTTSEPATAPASASPSVTKTATPSPSGQTVGDTYTDKHVEVTVQQVAIRKRLDFGGRYSGVLVKTCIKSTGDYPYFTLSWDPWTLVDDDAGRYPDTGSSGGSLPTPVYPNGEIDGRWHAGDCVKGWMFFDVPKGVKITTVRYQGGSMDEAVEWTVDP
ncbi:hypothetical protein H9L10_03475 [Phycicoccus endophyticus]|uniref:DUF4352 domain-containing protein n=1 Tax=Phycicoccus endophyticus TaxID=1690220 RepID=A0A7G9R3F4_9MICO|nr:hypothetical protein [Phycicoccus endophyticus]NHI19885.1 hypothetical protein [Phycicoccus endophyticus]QNN50129.1 hypothetical protein H9L10_03475 [Phycicoccus endophyticus]GGL27776.1 hypothetical protein GCM10012283_07480 [Phycicoccus endophyticus]